MPFSSEQQRKYLLAKEFDRNYDIRKDLYPEIAKTSLSDLKDFFESNQ